MESGGRPWCSAPSLVPSVATLLLLFLQTCTAMPHDDCPPSSCGKIHNISYPFRLKGDPPLCGDRRYELVCVNNATLVLTLFSGKYHVHDIDYKTYRIRVSDAGVVEDTTCSFIPRYFLHARNFTRVFFSPGFIGPLTLDSFGASRIGYLNCTNPVTDDPRYVDVNTTRCGSGGHIYAVFLKYSSNDFSVRDIKVGCHLKVATLANRGTGHLKVDSYADIQRGLVYGFGLSWLSVICEDRCGKGKVCRVINESTGEVRCDQGNCLSYSHGTNHVTYECGIWNKILDCITSYVYGICKVIPIHTGILQIIEAARGDESREISIEIGEFTGRYVLPIRFLLVIIVFFGLLIYKWRRRHTSMYDNIEDFLRDNTLMPIRYTYKEIKKMTRGFEEMLGQGGYGFVYKGKLRSGPFVAIKMLGKSKTNGQDFISEVATIGRIHHVNVVRLIGFCVEGSKRALVYEFMPNGSLDRYIFSKEGSISLTNEKMFEISLGVARGIAYLHQGCDMQILHFDIKPHNILLDENFIPKVSDFGLAKLYPIDHSIVTLTAARGTIGYMAPELFYQNIGGVSYKADVYSFGMLLMEIASRRRNLNPHAEHSSQLYFPFWIYNQLSEENEIEIEMEDVTNEERNNVTKKMFIVALWCIQLKPSDRPSMNKVAEMLEGEVESIEMPPKPSLYPHETIQEDLEINSDQPVSDDSTCSTTYLEQTAINPL